MHETTLVTLFEKQLEWLAMTPAFQRTSSIEYRPDLNSRAELSSELNAMNSLPAPLRDGADKPKGEIGNRLDTPEREAGLAALCALWRRGIVRFRLPGLAPLITDAGLPGRIRGAFGERLMTSASSEALAGQPCPWDPPCAFEALWRKQGRMAAGYDHASPWVLALDPIRGDLNVTLTIFGFANDFLAAAVEAMTAALVHGVDWRGQTQLFVPRITIAGRRVTETEGIAPPPAASGFVLDFLTPLVLSGADPRERPASLFTGLGQRLESLARWHDVTLGHDFGRPSLAARARELDFAFGECDIVTWNRGSRRQDRAIPMRGLMGRLEIGGAGARHPDVGAMLALGATCHIGADAAFGCGRYELGVIPVPDAPEEKIG